MAQYFSIMAWDGPEGESARGRTTLAHLAHVESVMDRIAIAGPLKTETGGNAGSLFIVKADNAPEAEALLKSDPYFEAGVWNRWEIRPFIAAAGEWVGGKTW